MDHKLCPTTNKLDIFSGSDCTNFLFFKVPIGKEGIEEMFEGYYSGTAFTQLGSNLYFQRKRQQVVMKHHTNIHSGHTGTFLLPLINGTTYKLSHLFVNYSSSMIKKKFETKKQNQRNKLRSYKYE